MIYSFKQGLESFNQLNSNIQSNQNFSSLGQKTLESNMPHHSSISREQIRHGSFVERLQNFSKVQQKKQNTNSHLSIKPSKISKYSNCQTAEEINTEQGSMRPISVIESETVFLNSKKGGNEIMNLRAKYDRALMQNAQLLCRMQSYYQQICALQTTIRKMEKQLMEKDNLQNKIYQMTQVNQSLQISFNEITKHYNHQIKELKLQLHNCNCQKINTNSKQDLLTEKYDYQNRVCQPSNAYSSQNQQMEKYRDQLDFHKEKVRDYDKRIYILESANQNLRSQKHQTQNTAYLVNQINRLKIQVQQLRMIATNNNKSISSKITQKQQKFVRGPLKDNEISRNVSVPCLVRKQFYKSPNKNISKRENFKQINKKDRPFETQNKQFKWKDLQQRINQLKNQNQIIQKHLKNNV